MNQNMVEMNKNMNKNMEEANKNFASLVATMKPDEWIDHISNRFDETLAKMMEGTGDVKTLVKNGNEVSRELLKFMGAFSTDELKDLSANIKQATGSMKSINDFMVKHSDDIDVLSEQMTLMPQMFVTLGAGMGMIDLKDADALVASMQPHDPITEVSDEDKAGTLDLLGSAEPISKKVMFLTKERMQYAAEHNYMKPLAEFATQLNTESKKAGSFKNYLTKDIMGKFWSAKDAKGNPIPVDKYMACAMLKMLIEMKQFKTSGSATAHVNGDMVGLVDGTMSLDGTISKLVLTLESQNPKIISATYDQYCKDIQSLSFY